MQERRKARKGKIVHLKVMATKNILCSFERAFEITNKACDKMWLVWKRRVLLFHFG